MTSIEELIDSAVEAYEVSGDAMRWGPELPARTAPEEYDGPARSYEEWLSPTPPQRRRIEAGEAVAMLAQLPRHPEPQRRHREVVDEPRSGCLLVPFIGGPWHRDLRAMPLPLAHSWNVPAPEPGLLAFMVDSPVVETPMPFRYDLRRMSGRLPIWPTSRAFVVYALGTPDRRQVEEALIVACDARWSPR